MRKLYGIALACMAATCCAPAFGQMSSGCESGYRVIAHRWDAILKVGWEVRQNCAHPEWPSRSSAVASIVASPAIAGHPMVNEPAPIVQPPLVHAGDQVRLWMDGGTVRMEMSGVAEQSARDGEGVIVQVTRQSDDEGLTVQRIHGIVRGAGDVEMER